LIIIFIIEIIFFTTFIYELTKYKRKINKGKKMQYRAQVLQLYSDDLEFIIRELYNFYCATPIKTITIATCFTQHNTNKSITITLITTCNKIIITKIKD